MVDARLEKARMILADLCSEIVAGFVIAAAVEDVVVANIAAVDVFAVAAAAVIVDTDTAKFVLATDEDFDCCVGLGMPIAFGPVDVSVLDTDTDTLALARSRQDSPEVLAMEALWIVPALASD